MTFSAVYWTKRQMVRQVGCRYVNYLILEVLRNVPLIKRNFVHYHRNNFEETTKYNVT